MYIQAQNLWLAEEQEKYLQVQYQTDQAVYFLPDYLFHEVDDENMEEVSENMREYTPPQLFME